MKRRVTYVSERGREFNTPKEAIAYDDELPDIIRSYEGDLRKYMAIENPDDEILERIDGRKWMIEDLNQLWERAKKSKEFFNMKEFN